MHVTKQLLSHAFVLLSFLKSIFHAMCRLRKSNQPIWNKMKYWTLLDSLFCQFPVWWNGQRSPIDIWRNIPLRFYLRTHCDCSIRGAQALIEWSQGWVRGLVRGGVEVTPSAPSVTNPMTPFTIHSTMRKALISSQWAVSHFITCHNDKSPGNDRDAHFTLMKCCDFADSLEDYFTKAP